MEWLKKYYGKDFEKFSPSVVKEGKKWAVVKLNRSNPAKGFSSIGYVLIQKHGTHASSPYLSLHEGVPTTDDMSEMLALLARKEGI